MINKFTESKDEYLMLREEILHLDTVINQTINFFYAFISAYIAFALTQNDTIFILLSYIGIIPPYLIVLNKMNGLCKIGAYLNVFHEGDNFNWERRHLIYKDKYESRKSRIISSHFPFIFVSSAVTGLLLYKTNWQCISNYDAIKIFSGLMLFLAVLHEMIKNRNISPQDYIEKWNLLILHNKDIK